MDSTAEKIIHRAQKFNASTKNLVERFCELNIYALSVLGSIGSISAPDEATLEDEAHASQCTTAGPYNAIPTSLLRVGCVCGLGPDLLVIHTLSLAARKRTAADSSALANGLAKIQAARENDHAPIYAVSSELKDNFLNPWPITPWWHMKLYVAWITMANLMNLLMARNERLPRPCSATNSKSRTLPDRSLHVLPEFLDQSVAIALRRSCPTCDLRSVLLVLGLLWVSYASSAMVFVRPKDLTSRAQMSRVGCRDEPDSLSHHNEGPLLYNFLPVWRQAIVPPRRGHLYHDLITKVFVGSL